MTTIWDIFRTSGLFCICRKRPGTLLASEEGEPRPVDAARPGIITVPNTSDSKLYAVVIGINTYPNLTPLKGAVADADQIAAFLTGDLKVPPNHITNLRNSAASREAIIKAFQALREDPRIEKGDPILIYYAGHGGSAKAPDEWMEKHGATDVQVIFPFDYGVEVAGSTVNCIPDKTIAALLNELAATKGDNITVIFDSCHSASANRGDEDSGRQSRNAEVTFDIPWNIDNDIYSTATPSATNTTDARHIDPPLCTNQSSHIHFAACGSDELAWEEDGRGAFTAALLKSIRASGVDKITYQNLMISLPILSKQAPQCYGVNKSRILFNSCVPSRKVSFIPVKFENDTLTLQAGAASGVTFKSVWELHESPTENSHALGRFRAETPGVSTTALQPVNADGDGPLSAGTRLYARQVQCGTGNELRVWFSPEAKPFIFPETEGEVKADSEDMVGSSEHEVGYVVHPARDSADIAVELHWPDSPDAEPEAVFHLCNSQAEKYGVATLERRKPARRDEVEAVLFAAAKWNWHLQRTSPTTRTKDLVKMEMMKVAEKTGTGIGEREYLPQPEADLNATGVVDFVVREKDLYGIRLTSRVGVPLYVRMFYFDMTDFSIFDMFGYSSSNSRADPELPARGQLLIGDDGDGGEPLPYGLNPGEKLEMGYMKVFWSTDPLELDNLEQGSAFGIRPSKRAESRKVLKSSAGMTKDWGTVLLTLVQRAP